MSLDKFFPEIHIWILEDDEEISFIYQKILELRYSLTFFSTLENFQQHLSNPAIKKPDLIISDLKLEDGNFFNFINGLKDSQDAHLEKMITDHFMVISSNNDIDLLRACLQKGALDYLIKPFDKNELTVKVEQIIDRKFANHHGPTTPQHHRNNFLNQLPELTNKEQKIFESLYYDSTKRLSRETLIQRVWEGQIVEKNVLDVHLSRLRKKLTDTPYTISFKRPNLFELSHNGMRVEQETILTC